jgi:DNA-binding MarR family transcriptional regulator
MVKLQNPREHDDFLNYQLKRLLAYGGAPAVRLCEGGYGVTRVEWRLTAALVESGPLSPSMLAGRTQMEMARVSRLVTGLMAKGLVERRDEDVDRRRALLCATSAGQRLYAELFPQLAQINRRIMDVLDDDEAAMLQACLAKLTRRARQLYEEGAGIEVRANRCSGGSRRFWT